MKNNCLICFKPLLDNVNLNFLLSNNHYVCKSCKEKFIKLNLKISINHVETTFLYEYNKFAKELIYKYKGCYDLALKDVFFDGLKEKIWINYHNYTIIFPPSYEKENQERGFVHMEEIIKTLHIKYENLFLKNKQYKQSATNFNKRNEVSKYIELKKNKKIENKKYLIVDDIFTSGNTLKAIINILIKNKVDIKNIKALIIFKVPSI